MTSGEQDLDRVASFRPSHIRCHCHGKKALLLDSHILQPKTSLRSPQTPLLQAFEKSEGAKALLLEIHVLPANLYLCFQ